MVRELQRQLTSATSEIEKLRTRLNVYESQQPDSLSTSNAETKETEEFEQPVTPPSVNTALNAAGETLPSGSPTPAEPPTPVLHPQMPDGTTDLQLDDNDGLSDAESSGGNSLSPRVDESGIPVSASQRVSGTGDAPEEDIKQPHDSHMSLEIHAQQEEEAADATASSSDPALQAQHQMYEAQQALEQTHAQVQLYAQQIQHYHGVQHQAGGLTQQQASQLAYSQQVRFHISKIRFKPCMLLRGILLRKVNCIYNGFSTFMDYTIMRAV